MIEVLPAAMPKIARVLPMSLGYLEGGCSYQISMQPVFRVELPKSGTPEGRVTEAEGFDLKLAPPSAKRAFCVNVARAELHAVRLTRDRQLVERHDPHRRAVVGQVDVVAEVALPAVRRARALRPVQLTAYRGDLGKRGRLADERRNVARQLLDGDARRTRGRSRPSRGRSC